MTPAASTGYLPLVEGGLAAGLTPRHAGVLLGFLHAIDDPRRRGLEADFTDERCSPLEAERDALAEICAGVKRGPFGNPDVGAGYEEGYERALALPLGPADGDLEGDVAELRDELHMVGVTLEAMERLLLEVARVVGEALDVPPEALPAETAARIAAYGAARMES